MKTNQTSVQQIRFACSSAPAAGHRPMLRTARVWGVAVSAALAAMSAIGPVANAQPILHVDENATGPAHDGSSWCLAFLEVHEALAVATQGAVIRVADGTYLPDSVGLPDPRDATFELIGGVAIEGGYAGCDADDPDERDIVQYETILSGDLVGPNAYHVVTAGDVDATAVLDGFTITGGHADGAGQRGLGGGLYNGDASPTLSQCTFAGNFADDGGGGMYNASGSPALDGCRFTGNSTGGYPAGGGGLRTGGNPTLAGCRFDDNSAVFGGGLFNAQGTPTLSECTFEDNAASGSGGGMYNFANPGVGDSATLIDCVFVSNTTAGFGAAMRNWDADPSLQGCVFQSNLAVERGGAIANGGSSSPTLIECLFLGNGVQSFVGESFGGAISNFDNAQPTFDGCTFSGNSATGFPGRGGAMYNAGASPTVSRSLFVANGANFGGAIYNDLGADLTLINTELRNNSTGGDGGAIYTFSSSMTAVGCLLNGNATTGDGGAMFNDQSNVTVTNCTLHANSAGGRGGGIFNYAACEVALTNGILWSNEDTDGAGETSQVFNNPSNLLDMNYTCVLGLTGVYGGVGNIGDDPLFKDPAGPDQTPGTEDDDLHVLVDSPCVDTADNAAVPPWVVEDLDGNPRIADGDGDGVADVDMGAYEREPIAAVPAVSTAGLILMALMLVAAGGVVGRRRRARA